MKFIIKDYFVFLSPAACSERCSKIKEYARKHPFLVPYHERVFDNISVSKKKKDENKTKEQKNVVCQ